MFNCLRIPEVYRLEISTNAAILVLYLQDMTPHSGRVPNSVPHQPKFKWGAMEILMTETAAKSPAWPDCYLNTSNRDISECGCVSPNWQHVVSSDWYPHRYHLLSADGHVFICVRVCACLSVSVHTGILVCIIMDPPVQSEKHFTLLQPSAETDLHHSSEYNYHAGENGAEKRTFRKIKKEKKKNERERG